jgi:hypothetical protein
MAQPDGVIQTCSFAEASPKSKILSMNLVGAPASRRPVQPNSASCRRDAGAPKHRSASCAQTIVRSNAPRSVQGFNARLFRGNLAPN